MSDGASTSKECEENESDKSKLLQQALSEAGTKRAQVQRKSQKHTNGVSSSTLETQKAKIRKHPLMPLVKILLEKCEQASNTMQISSYQMDDVIQLLAQMELASVSIKTEDPAVDELMVNAAVALRTQLAELQKVSTLAESFYANYSSTLRKRVNQESLIGSSNDSDEEATGTPTPETDMGRFNQSSMATITTANGMITLPLRVQQHPLNFFHSNPATGQRHFMPPILDVSSALPVPFNPMPFFSIPNLQSIHMQSRSGNNDPQE